MDAAIQLTSIGCNIVACIQSVSSVINYHIKATMDASMHAGMHAGMHATKLNACVGCLQIDASIGWSINFCIQNFQVPAIIIRKQKIMQSN